MAYRINPVSLTVAIKHLCRYGDTDVFPHLPELAFFEEAQEDIVAELAKLDLDTYTPAGAVEALAPKSRYGFRIAHQLPALDTLLLLACVVDIGEQIEAKRQPGTSARAFSYRFSPDPDTGQLFRADRTYKDWLHRQQQFMAANAQINHVVSTDISDYYYRINFHRLENLLNEAAHGHGAARFIKKHIRIIRATQSFGLPMGGSAARLLAELAMCDTDQALCDTGLLATRFVDDFRVFLHGSTSAYDALGFLAEQLAINEGLALNVAKTTVATREEYVERLERLTTDVGEEAEGVALDALTAELYFDEEPDEEDLERLKGLNLVELLSDEINDENWDVGRIKVIFRALKIAKPTEAIQFIIENFEDLVVFAKEVCLLMETLEAENPHCFDDLLNMVCEAILRSPASNVQLIRTWLLEIFVRDVIRLTLFQVQQLDVLPAVIDKRQLLLLRGLLGDKNYFRKQKTAVHSYSEFERPALVMGASCLPSDEYSKWINFAKVGFNRPLDDLFLKWAAQNKGNLLGKITVDTLDHPE